MKNSKNKFELKIYTMVIFLIILATVLNYLLMILRIAGGEMQFQDFHARWQETAYFFRGINPFDVLKGKAYLKDIGNIDPDMVTVPWAWIWGIVINPGFLPYNIAKIWGIAVYIVVILGTTIVLYKKFVPELPEDDGKTILAIIISSLLIAQYNLPGAFLCGNHGALSCCFIIISVCIHREHKIAATLLMTLAMIKPQVAMPFFLTFLMVGEFGIVAGAVLLELVTIVILWGVTGENIIVLLKNVTGVGTNLEGVFFGILNELKYYNINRTVLLVGDMILGLAYEAFMTYGIMKIKEGRIFRKQSNGNVFYLFFPAAIASTFWFYKQPHDLVILVIPAIVMIKICIENYGYNQHNISRKQKIKSVIMLLLMISTIYIFYVQGLLRRLAMKLIPAMTEGRSKGLFMTFTSVYFIILGIYIYFETIRSNKS